MEADEDKHIYDEIPAQHKIVKEETKVEKDIDVTTSSESSGVYTDLSKRQLQDASDYHSFDKIGENLESINQKSDETYTDLSKCKQQGASDYHSFDGGRETINLESPDYLDLVTTDTPDVSQAKDHPDFKKPHKFMTAFKLWLCLSIVGIIIGAIVLTVVLLRNKDENSVNIERSTTASNVGLQLERPDLSPGNSSSVPPIILSTPSSLTTLEEWNSDGIIRDCRLNETEEEKKDSQCLERIEPELVIDVRAVNKKNSLDVRVFLPLPDGSCLVSSYKNKKHSIIKLDSSGVIKKTLLVQSDWVYGLVHSPPFILVLMRQIIVMIKEDGHEVGRYKVEGVRNLYDGIETEQGLVLVENYKNYGRNPVFIGILYAVCELGKNRINLYDGSWKLVRHIGEKGTNDGQFYGPNSIVFLPYVPHNILVADFGTGKNGRLMEFDVTGKFIQRLPSNAKKPKQIEFLNNSLWLLYELPNWKDGSYIYKYKIHQ